MAMKIQITLFWVVIPCSNVLGYQCFGGPCYMASQPRRLWLVLSCCFV